jgi:hypothetical protein
VISIRSRHSRRALAIQRPAIAFARGAFRVSVRARAPGGNLHDLDTGTGQHHVKGRGELPGLSRTRNRKLTPLVTQIHQQVADLLRVHGPSGLAVTPRICT